MSDGAGPHGIQIFDLTRLRTMKPQPNGLPQKVEADFIYRNVNSVHDMVINEESGFGYPVGSSGGGNDVRRRPPHDRHPASRRTRSSSAASPTPEPGAPAHGLLHDAQCVNYKGPDKRYKGREICIGSNETMLSLQDVTDKTAPKVISRAAYPKVGYTHQGWLTEDHKYFYLDDELDETARHGRQDAHAHLGLHRPREPEAREGALQRRRPRPITTCTSRATCCTRRTTAPACAC